MSITHPTAIRNGIVDGVVDLLDLGSGNANGQLIFQTSGAAEVATLNMAIPAFGASASGTATANAIASDTNATGGTTTKFELQDRDSGAVILGSVGTSGQDINLSSNIIAATDTVAMTSLTYTGPA